ncbi:hypothetical protein COLU111180_00555 [Cohnella lubricantis]|uniref:GNAT family N-acetyltransferase n=1 Tax=Cohnella lubricantis TaxID=2163172 RepID=UPI0035E220F5|nr:RimJ/RimL family protein N-acetyltransferase [Cohnella lubricantis]
MTIENKLRETVIEDLPIFFEHESDPAARYMAGFTPAEPDDRDAFDARWEKTLNNKDVRKMTVLVNGQAAGHLLSFQLFGEPTVGYWIGRSFWGQGVASAALSNSSPV